MVGERGWWGELRCSGFKDPTHCSGLRDVLEGMTVGGALPRGWTQDGGCHLLTPGTHGPCPQRPSKTHSLEGKPLPYR